MGNATQQAIPGLNGKTLSPLIDFNFIVNTDIGLIRLIRENYQDDRVFNLDILNKSDREILSLLYSQKSFNPLKVISDKSDEELDELYKSFFDSYREDIVNKSTVAKSTDAFIKIISSSGNNFGVSAYIAVQDSFEKAQINSHYPGINCIFKTSKKEILSKDPYYVRDYRFFTDMKIENISRKKIYIQPRQCNVNYLENTVNNLTSNNVFIFAGNDYKLKGETNNE